jgi:hypothetical protein
MNDEALGYLITKASGPEERFTFGPLYAPDRLDAHGEWVDASTLQKAVWEYVKASAAEGRRINLQGRLRVVCCVQGAHEHAVEARICTSRST